MWRVLTQIEPEERSPATFYLSSGLTWRSRQKALQTQWNLAKLVRAFQSVSHYESESQGGSLNWLSYRHQPTQTNANVMLITVGDHEAAVCKFYAKGFYFM